MTLAGAPAPDSLTTDSRFTSVTLVTPQRTIDAKIRPTSYPSFKAVRNQLAFKASILELSNWLEQCSSADVA